MDIFGILSREETKIMIEFLFFIDLLYTLFYRISSMIVCKNNEIFDERLNIYIYLIFFIGIFSEEKIMINEIQRIHIWYILLKFFDGRKVK